MSNNLFQTKNKIIAIPFAGGNRFSFKSLEKYVPQDLDWVTLESPGRGSRFSEKLLETIEELSEDLLDQLIPHIQNSDYMIYGHSLGTLLGYEVTKKIVQQNLKLPICLFFTGRGAPGYNRFQKKKSLLPKDLFWKEVSDIGGLPKEILAHEDLLDMYYPILKSDFKAIEDYQYHRMEKLFPIPIHICMGTEEIGDGEEKTSVGNMKAWENETNANCTFELLQGDHFFIFKHQKAVVQKIINTAMAIRTSVA